MTSKCKQIFILSGQSNMAGQGGVTTQTDHHNHRHKHWNGVVPPECLPHHNILRLNAHLNWEEAREPLHADIDTKEVCGVGPGMPFANAVRERVEGTTTIGLVPCAVGGTGMKEWARGGQLYESMVKRAEAAVAEGGEIVAVLWFQGESDTSTAEDAAAFKERLEKMICDLRDDLQLPLLPFVQVALASGDEKYIEEVRAVQLGMKLPNVVCVDAKGLKLNSDNLHLSTEAQVQLGLMLADAYLCNFQPPPWSPEEPQPCSVSKGKSHIVPASLFYVSCFLLVLAFVGSVLLSLSFLISHRFWEGTFHSRDLLS